jgi:SPP1 gp7 family putative phage head morphogenesis protein
MEELIEENNDLLEEEELAAIAAIIALLDQGLNRLARQLFAQLESGPSLLASTEELLYELIPVEPLDVADDPVLQSVEKLLQKSTVLGLDLAAELSKPLVSAPVAVGIGTALVQSAAVRARGYIGLQARSFSESVAEAINTGLIDGGTVKDLTTDLKRRLNVTNARVATIIRTEASKARSEAVFTYYAQQGIDLVWYYVALGERTCQHCAAQAGKVFKRGAIRVLRHHNCHCSLLAYKLNESDKKSPVDTFRLSHRKRVLSYAKAKGIQLNEGPAAFDTSRPIPYGKNGLV